jgi:simple sugar transport system permease protein
MKYMGASVPPYLMIPVMTVVCIVSGMIWGIIPAFFKAKYNTNETLFTLMMNYVAMQLVRVMIAIWVPSGSGILQAMKVGKLPVLFGIKPLFNIMVVAVLTVGMYVYLKYSKHGYEISVVGESENTARYIGINVKKVILRTVLISGALCGVMGWILAAGTAHSITANSVGGNGFTAIMISWMSKFNPVVMVFSSLLVCFLQRGAGEIASTLRLNSSVGEVLTGVIILFIISSEFFINYKINFRHKKQKEETK